jgi:hypothetical protein
MRPKKTLYKETNDSEGDAEQMRIQLLPKRRANVNPQGEQSGRILETIAAVNLKHSPKYM